MHGQTALQHFDVFFLVQMLFCFEPKRFGFAQVFVFFLAKVLGKRLYYSLGQFVLCSRLGLISFVGEVSPCHIQYSVYVCNFYAFIGKCLNCLF